MSFVYYLIAILGKLTDIVIVLVANAIDLFEYFTLHTVGLRVARRPLARVVVFRLHDVVKRRYLHVAIQRNHFTLLEDFVDLRQIDAFLGVELVYVEVLAVEETQREANDLITLFIGVGVKASRHNQPSSATIRFNTLTKMCFS